VGIRQEHKEHCSAYFAAYNSVTNSANKGLEHRQKIRESTNKW